MKNVIKILFYVAISLLACSSYANSYNVKLAVFDSIEPDPLGTEVSQELINSYLSGINTAIQSASRQGMYIEKREFLHNESLTNVIEKAAATNSWQPDIIMGFHTSNDFLMAKAFFNGRLILSVSATDSQLSILPDNFYSLGIPDQNATKIIINFINNHYPNANLFITVGAESKESVDFANLVAKSYKEHRPKQRVLERKFLTEDMNILKLSKFMDGYQPGDIIIIMPTSYYSSIELMNKIAAYLNPIKPIFIICIDNWRDDRIPQIIKKSYEAFRISGLDFRKDSDEYKEFSKNFVKIYHTKPTNAISFITYRTVMSFVKALKKYPPPTNITTTKAILWSYQKALKHDPNWFRSRQYIVYKLKGQKEVYFEMLKQYHSGVKPWN